MVLLDSNKSIEKEGRAARGRAIYHIWPDFEISKLTIVSITTMKADAARNAFGALGKGIAWAVMDSGIDRDHPHFSAHKNLNLSNDDAAGLGGPADRFGGVGRNGAQHTPEADNSSPLGPNNCSYSFQTGTLHNLNADSAIQGRSDIRRGEVAHALLCSIATT